MGNYGGTRLKPSEVGNSALSSHGPDQPDSDHSFNPWEQFLPIQVIRPDDSYEQRTAGEALQRAWQMTPDQIRQIRPPIPTIGFLPPRFGYDTHTLGIKDVVRLDDLFRRVDYSQRQSGYSGTATPVQNQF